LVQPLNGSALGHAAAPLDRIESLLAIADIARTLHDFRPLAEALPLICESVVGMGASDFATVFVNSEDDSLFQMWGDPGIKPEYIAWARRISRLERRTAPVYTSSASGRSLVVTDVFQRPDVHMLWEGARIQGYRALAVLPIVARGRVLGTLNCYGREPHEHSADEVELLQTVARLAGVAVETAMIAEHLHESADEQRRLSLELSRRNDDLQELSRAQIALAEALADADDDPADVISTRLAAELGLSVMVVSGDGKQLAFAGDATVRADMAGSVARRDSRRLASLDGQLVGSSSVHRVGHDRLLGVLLVYPALTDPGDSRSVLVRAAAALLALELESARADSAVLALARPTALHSLARGRFSHGQAQEAAQMIEAAGRRLRLAFISIPDDRIALTVGRRLNRLPGRTYCLAAAAEADGVLVLVEDPGLSNVRAHFNNLLAQAGQPPHPVAVSAPFDDVADVPRAADQARTALPVAMKAGIVLHEELGPVSELMRHVPREGAEEYVQRLLGPLLESDRERRTALVPTLAAYLRFRGAARLAAAELEIHPNTLQLRLARAAQLTDLDLHDPRTLGLLSVAIAWHELISPAPSALV
jgi:DNA-binding PucR family transcriptional regulator